MAAPTNTLPPVINPSPQGAEPQNNPNQQQPITINFPPSIKVEIPGQLEVKAETRQADQHKQWYNEPDAWVAILTGCLVFVTGVLAWFTLKLWRATKKLVRDAKDTSKKELRAYVGVSEAFLRYSSIATDSKKISALAVEH